MKKWFVLALMGLTSTYAMAQTPTVAPANESQGNRTEVSQGPSEKESTAPFSVEGEVNTLTSFYFRGYKYFDSGYIVQPEVTFSLNEFKAGGFGITPYVNVWANVTEDAGPSGFWNHLNEVDVNPGVDLTWDKLPKFTLEVQYNTNFFPSGVPNDLVGKGLEGQSQELGFTLKYGTDDDSFDIKTLKASDGILAALHPHVSYYQEFEDRGDGSRDAYLEAGLEPAFKVTDKLSFTVPATLGMSTDSYYVKNDGSNDFLGYAGVGIHPKYQINDHWDIHASVDYIYLISDSVVSTNDGERNVFIGGIGVGFSY